MFVTKLDLQGVEETITRNVLITVVNDVKKLIGVSSDVKMFLDEEDESVDRIKDSNQNIHDRSSPRYEGLWVDYKEDASEGYNLSLVPNHDTNYPIYYDADILSKITPVMQKRTFSLTFKYFNKSKSKVNAITNRLRLMSTNDGMYIDHDLEYHYVLQTYIIHLLNNINNLKNKRLSTPIELEDYIANTFDDRADWVNSLDGNPLKGNVGIREKQTNVTGYITTELHNITKTEDKDKTGFILEFEYMLEMEKPISLYLQYPMLVYNSVIDKRFLIRNKPKRSIDGLRTKDSASLQEFGNERTFRDLITYKDYVRIPYEDSYTISVDIPGYRKYLSTIAMVNEDNLRELFYIEDIPNITFDPSILELIKLEKDYIPLKQRSLFSIDLFDNNRKVYDTKVILTVEDVNGVEKIKLSTDKDLKLTGYYRVMFSFMYDLDFLADADIKRIDNTIKDIEDDNPNLSNILKDGLIKLYNLNRIDNVYVKDISMYVDRTARMAMKTVSIYSTKIIKPN